uniref:SH2 domain-containing protein n=1 Tax=Pseudonaja textilis TaxID=8673 RepID=A0A670Z8D4_PSETE
GRKEGKKEGKKERKGKEERKKEGRKEGRKERKKKKGRKKGREEGKKEGKKEKERKKGRRKERRKERRNCDRRTAEAALLQFNKNSAFMVRQSSHHSASQPFTLVVFYKNRVYNVPIHYQESSCKFALGKDPKNHENLQNITSAPLLTPNYV